MNKTAFTFIAITILLLASFIPAGNAIATKENETKTMEVPVQIYTLHGVKEIRKELPIDEAMKLQKMAYEAKEAMEILFNKNASFIEKVKAHAIIDSFSYEMKKNELLGNLSIKEVKDLIMGKYFMKNRNSMEMQRLNAMAKFFQQNGWQVNAMCGMFASGLIIDIHPWNLILLLLSFSDLIIIGTIAFLLLVILDAIPHPTTIGYWLIGRPHPEVECGIYTMGLFGIKSLENREISAWLFGFSGVVVFNLIAIGFCPFIAMKRVE
ncbi:MAG: hypothetical protein J7K95_07840 [Thermoplasmata archaeon]|nr:hypothetical protein [Thermoplasmata archaeon]